MNETRVTTIKRRKSDNDVISSNAFSVEDEFAGLYLASGGLSIIEPPYNPRTLYALSNANNTLNQCIAAMEVNIDGTGHDLVKLDSDVADDDVEVVREFFATPYPDVSFVTIRRALRRDIEITGNGYLEVMRNSAGKIIFVRHVPSVTMRLCKLGKAVNVQKIVTRGGEEQSVTVAVRERVFAQKIGTGVQYFSQFGASRKLNKKTGEWDDKTKPSEIATEIIHFTNVIDSSTPYGLPRWINQLPSVLGSRKAEEHNLDFFSSGGLPPALITISGGQMLKGTKEALERYINGDKNRNRAAIVEAYSSGGSTTAAGGSVKIDVVTFGSERQKDSMFEGYDARCEERVRGSFRLPPIFVGKASDYSFATAYASYTVAEAQVFAPERIEFDEIITNTIIRGLGITGVKFRSNVITAKDAGTQISALNIASGINGVSDKDLVSAVNSIAGTNIEYTEPEAPLQKSEAVDLLALVKDWGGYLTGDKSASDFDVSAMAGEIMAMPESRRRSFYYLVATQVFPDMSDDPEGAVELTKCLSEAACEH